MGAKRKSTTSDLLYQANALQERTDRELLGQAGAIKELEAIAELASRIDILWDQDGDGMDDFEFHETLEALRVALRPWRTKRAGKAALATFDAELARLAGDGGTVE